MIRLLLYIKRKGSFLWNAISTANDWLFGLLYERRIRKHAATVLREHRDTRFTFRMIEERDLDPLTAFFQQQEEQAFTYFKPHCFDQQTLRQLHSSHSFFLFGAFNPRKEIIGYCFLRCFINRQAFRGKMVDKHYQGRGIAKEMGRLLSDICWRSHFRLFATVAKENTSSLRSSGAVNTIRIVNELPNDYIQVEYLPKRTSHV